MIKRGVGGVDSKLISTGNDTKLSPWWRYSALLVFLVGLVILIYLCRCRGR